MPDNSSRSALTYTNPVYAQSFPDPFVLKFRGEYFAYSTGIAPDGNAFEILRSVDLVHWAKAGSAMETLPHSPPFYWAPEVTYSNGKFYLYYSVGNETLMELRVAVSNRPDGGFRDSGKRLTLEEFAIDAHVFIDDDGRKYMFYATDFLDHTHIGTGTVVDEMLDWFTLAGKPRPVTRARFDWQVYDPNRKEKGGVRWHTVEGPTVLKRKGVYYEMFSGGNWQNTTYGVSFAVTDSLHNDDEWEQFSDGEKVLPILRTIPDLAVGPGHNSVIRGPNNRELYCVYHRWADEGRILAIDRMDFSGSQIFVIGSTYTPQPFPFLTSSKVVSDHLLEPFHEWEPAGEWTFSGTEAISDSADNCSITIPNATDFLLEATVNIHDHSNASRVGFRTNHNGLSNFSLEFLPENRQVEAESPGLGGKVRYSLPADFDPAYEHLWRIELEGRRLLFRIDEAAFRTSVTLPEAPNSIEFFSESASMAISGLALTEGFEDLFEDPLSNLESRGWEITGGGEISLEQHHARIRSRNEASLFKTHRETVNLECAVNVRIVESYAGSTEYGLVMVDTGGSEIVHLLVRPKEGKIYIRSDDHTRLFDFPPAFNTSVFHQLRIIKTGGALLFYLNENLLFDIRALEKSVWAKIRCNAGAFDLDMARLTLLS